MSLLDDDELKKYLLKQNREMGRPGYDAGLGPPDMYGNQSPHTQEGWKDVIRKQLETNQFGPDLPGGLGLLDSREQAQQVLGHELVDNMGPQLQPSLKDMMDTSGPRFVQDPYANAEMNPMHSKYAGTQIPFPSQGDNELRGQINALYSQMNPNRELPPQGGSPHEGWYSGTPMAFDDPSIAGTPITAPGGPAGSVGVMDMAASPEQMRAMQEQIGGPGFWDAPRFASANEPIMDDKIRYSDRSDPNFNAPMSFHGGSPSGLLSSEVTPTNKGGKWEETPEGEDSIFRRKKKKDGMENYMAKYLMQLGDRISSNEDAGWRRN